MSGDRFEMPAAVFDDLQIRRLHPTLFKTWFNLLCLHHKWNHTLPWVNVIAWELRQPVRDTEHMIEALVDDGLIDRDSDGNLTPSIVFPPCDAKVYINANVLHDWVVQRMNPSEFKQGVTAAARGCTTVFSGHIWTDDDVAYFRSAGGAAP